VKINPLAYEWRSVDVIDPETGVVDSTFGHVPVKRCRPAAQRQFAINEEYALIPFQARSRKSHSYFFAALHAAFQNIPEKMAPRWPSEEHFRKWLLIETGFYTEKEFTFEGRGAEREARMLGAFFRAEDEYARVWIIPMGGEDNREQALDAAMAAWKGATVISENVPGDVDAAERERMRISIRACLKILDRGRSWKVIVRKAMSQDHQHMDKELFQRSSRAVLDMAAELTSVTRRELIKAGGES
jgi:hypothetical protein